MKRLIVYIICSAFLVSFAGNAAAVQKKDKKDVKKQVVQKKPAKKPPVIPKSRATLKGKKYDSFVDRNKNGIDDRREQLKKKPAAKAKKQEEKKDK